VGETGRHEPHHLDAITDAELQRALADPDPLRGIAQLTARLGAAFTLDPAGVTRSTALGTERIARKLRDALPAATARCATPCGNSCARCSRPNSQRSTTTRSCSTTTHATSVALATHRAASSLDDLDLDLGELESPAVSSAHTRSLPPKPPAARAGDRGRDAPARSRLA
jgi:hypothetical protein